MVVAKPRPQAEESGWRRYFREKRILRIRSLRDAPGYLWRGGEGGFQFAHAYLWFMYFVLCMIPIGGVFSVVIRPLPPLMAQLVWALGLLAGVEAADYLWLRSHRQLEKAGHRAGNIIAILVFGGVLLFLALPAFRDFATGLGQGWAEKFENFRQDFNHRKRPGVPVIGPEEGDNWRILTEDSPGGKVWLQAKAPEARSVCARLGEGWGLPSNSERLRALRPHPQLKRSIHVWIEGGKIAAQLDPKAETSGRAIVLADPEDWENVLCTRE